MAEEARVVTTAPRFEALARAIAEAVLAKRQADGDPNQDAVPFKIRESVRLAKFDHTPAEGEALEPFEVVEIHDGQWTVVVAPPSREE